MYEEMGDHISLQYGGSIAHHADTGKKKSIFAQTAEMFTSIQRHFANNFTDPQKQNVLNLFLGIYQPLQNKSALWNINDDRDLLSSQETQELNPLYQKWWERHLRGFEASLPRGLMRELHTYFREEKDENPDELCLIKSFEQDHEESQIDTFLLRSITRPVAKSLQGKRPETIDCGLEPQPKMSLFESRPSTGKVKRPLLSAQDFTADDSDHNSEELRHNCHSDADSKFDQNPFFEYNKCDTVSSIEKKLEDRIHRFQPIALSRLQLKTF